MTLLHPVKAVLFDLDNTIFDHNRGQALSLAELYEKNPDVFNGVGFQEFYEAYVINNELVWKLLVEGKIAKNELRLKRFADVLDNFGLDSTVSGELTKKYLDIYCSNNYFLPGAEAALKKLKQRFKLGIISNGFTEIQYNKIDKLGITSWLDVIILSEEAGVMKPNKDIFLLAVRKMGCKADESVFAGDSYNADIRGAAGAGMKPVWINPDNKEPEDEPPQYILNLKSISELPDILFRL